MDAVKRPLPHEEDGATSSILSPSKRIRIDSDAADTPLSPATNGCKIFACEYEGCGRAFDRPSKLEIHIRCHTNERPYACKEPGCDKTFQRNEHLTRHLKDKHAIGDVQEFRCTYLVTNEQGVDAPCGKTLTTASKLRRHVNMHKDKESLKCRELGCGKMFRKAETLQRHIKQDHLGQDAFNCTHTVFSPDGSTHECGETFATVGLLKGHESRAHGGYRFFCDLCVTEIDPMMDLSAENGDDLVSIAPRLGFFTHAEFQNHMKIEHPPSCPECGLQCESSRALRAHIEIVHRTAPERQKYKCDWPDCNRGFTKAGNLHIHKQTVHIKVREFVCGSFDLSGSSKVIGWDGQGCGRALTTKASLEEHVRTQHLGLPSKLKKQVKSEASDSASTLMDIDEISTPIDHRAVAMLTGHGYEKSRPIACLVPDCRMRFTRDYDLVQHVELTHGWHIDDVNDAVAERDALSGDQFWIGGCDDVEDRSTGELTRPVESTQETLLRAQLQTAVDAAFAHRKAPNLSTELHESYGMVLDPALE